MDYLKLFLDHLKIDKGASPHTLAAYSQDIKQFMDSLGASHSAELLNAQEENIQAFLKKLKSTEHRSTSIARKVSALKQFYKFAVSEELIQEDPTLFIEAPVRTHKLPKALDAQSILKLLKAVEEGLPYPETHNSEGSAFRPALRARDSAMIFLLYATGLRVTELTTLKVSQIDIEGGFLKVLGKRGKERLVPFAPVAGEKVHEYLTQYRLHLKPETDVLFVGQRGEPMTRQGFWKLLKKIATLAGLPNGLHPHMLRHTFATDLLNSGMNLRSLQMLLGHADLQTTQIYTHMTSDSLAEVIKRYHPRGK